MFFRGLIQQLELKQILDPQPQQFEQERREIHPHYLWGDLLGHPAERLLGVHAETLAIEHPACSTCALHGCASATGDHNHAIHSFLGIVNLDLNVTTVDYILDVGDGDGAFCHIGSQDDLPLATVLEDLTLALQRQTSMQGDYLNLLAVLETVGVQHTGHPFDLFY